MPIVNEPSKGVLFDGDIRRAFSGTSLSDDCINAANTIFTFNDEADIDPKLLLSFGLFQYSIKIKLLTVLFLR